WLATHHYENFNVVSWLLPKELHRHFYNLYAYCRWADDLGDEVPDSRRALELLDWWESELNACYEGRPSHAVFVALRETILEKNIPRQPLAASSCIFAAIATRSASSSLTPRAPRFSSPTSGRTSRATSKRAASIFLSMSLRGTASPNRKSSSTASAIVTPP